MISRPFARRIPLLLAAGLAALAPRPAAAQSVARDVPRRPVATYSIVARDPATGELGVAVQSHWFSVGSVVPWAEAGVGAVATQSFIDPSYGPLGLALMRAGRSAPEALEGLLKADPHPEVRQVAMIDAQGRVAAHTGASAIPAAGDRTGENYSVQANLMEKATVWPAMARAFESAKGDLAERLMAALEAAQAEGGDVRGRQSAAILVVSGEPTGRPWEDRIFDLRVEDSPQPLEELRRVLNLARAYRDMNAGDEALTRNDVPGAVEHYRAAMERVPDNAEMTYWTAVTLASTDQVDGALPLFEKAFAAGSNWAVLTPRLVVAGQFPKDPALLRRVLSVPGGQAGMEEWRRLATAGEMSAP